ncbi:MAG: protoheme IX farnesyltransferase [Tenuifilaceae bacterium]
MKQYQNNPNFNSQSLSFFQKVKDIVSLSKLIVSASVTFTTLTGYVISKNGIDFAIIPTLIGVFLLAAGASAINHIIERRTDALMPRTKNRPIASGRMSVLQAKIWTTIFLLSGTIILIYFTNPACTILGLINVLWYNLIYTPLKKITVWALFAGTITGIIPFFMGVVAVTNELPTAAYYFIGLYMFLWQIPHFLLIICKFGVEYEQAGLASITQKTTVDKILIISYMWMITSCIASLFLPLFGITQHFITGIAILIISILVLLFIAIRLFGKTKSQDYKTPFIITNLMQTGFMVTLVVDSLVFN